MHLQLTMRVQSSAAAGRPPAGGRPRVRRCCLAVDVCRRLAAAALRVLALRWWQGGECSGVGWEAGCNTAAAVTYGEAKAGSSRQHAPATEAATHPPCVEKKQVCPARSAERALPSELLPAGPQQAAHLVRRYVHGSRGHLGRNVALDDLAGSVRCVCGRCSVRRRPPLMQGPQKNMERFRNTGGHWPPATKCGGDQLQSSCHLRTRVRSPSPC